MSDQKAMIKAVKHNDCGAVAAMLTGDPALVHALDTDGSTPLHLAAWKGLPEMAKLLLEHGAEVHRENQNTHWGGTPLHAAAHADNKPVADMLIAHGADINFRSFLGRTPIEETTIHNAKSVAKLLREHGAQ